MSYSTLLATTGIFHVVFVAVVENTFHHYQPKGQMICHLMCLEIICPPSRKKISSLFLHAAAIIILVAKIKWEFPGLYCCSHLKCYPVRSSDTIIFFFTINNGRWQSESLHMVSLCELKGTETSKHE